MTRLRAEDLAPIGKGWEAYDQRLMVKTGMTLAAIACRAANIDHAVWQTLSPKVSVAAVPVTAGQGIIAGFAAALRDIALHVGCQAFNTEATDVAGLAEAYARRADIILLSDDVRCVAINTHLRHVVDNSEATGRGFAVMLEIMSEEVHAFPCLVIGCGPVGDAAAETLARRGASLMLCDTNIKRAERVQRRIADISSNPIDCVAALPKDLKPYQGIVDATPAANIIAAEDIRANTYIVAPGVPHGLTAEAVAVAGNRFFHDPLPLGVATMVVSAAAAMV